MFNVKLSNIQQGTSSLSRNAQPADLHLQEENAFVAPIQIDLHFDRVGKNIFIKAEIECTLALTCDRCSEPYSSELHETIRLLYTTDTDFKDQEDDLVFVIRVHEQDVDLSEPLRETMILALPAKQLCRDDCKGLCPHCGTNLNESSCTCKSQTIDSRWDKLKDLFKSN